MKTAGWLWGAGIWMAVAGTAAGQLYAEVTTTGGRFTAELDFERAPRTVAHFLRLVEGGAMWMDPVTGAARGDPWYAESAFYRVQYVVEPTEGVTNVLCLQGGLREVGGAWTGDVGFGVLDEATNGLCHTNGVLSMVQEGPHLMGAEWMVMLGDGGPYWDGLQTVFGRVVEGLDAVRNLAETQVGGWLPEAARMTGISIRREGAAAEAFYLHARERADLPVVEAVGMGLAFPAAGTGRVTYVQSGHAETWLWHTAELGGAGWTGFSLGFNSTTQTTEKSESFVTTEEGWNHHFFHAMRVGYPVYSAPPVGTKDGAALEGIQFAVKWMDGTVYQYVLDLVACTGMYRNVSTTGSVVRINDCYLRTRTGNTVEFNFMDQYGNVFDYALGFETEGAVSGRYYLVMGNGMGFEWGDCEWMAWPGTRGVSAKAARGVRGEGAREWAWPDRRGVNRWPRGFRAEGWALGD